MDEAELARRSIAGFGETLACLGRTRVGGAREVRLPGLIGARIPWAADNPWIDAAAVLPGATAPDAGADGDAMPRCLWTAGPGPAHRRLLTDVEMPCMALALDAAAPPVALTPETPPWPVVGELNDRAYGQRDRLAPLIAAFGGEERLRAHGVRVDGTWACVAVTLRHDEDVSIQYVATEVAHRRRGLAGGLLAAVLAEARADGARTATLQASPDGRPVYERLGFSVVTVLRGFVADR